MNSVDQKTNAEPRGLFHEFMAAYNQLTDEYLALLHEACESTEPRPELLEPLTQKFAAMVRVIEPLAVMRCQFPEFDRMCQQYGNPLYNQAGASSLH